jgi:hypothetical protein
MTDVVSAPSPKEHLPRRAPRECWWRRRRRRRKRRQRARSRHLARQRQHNRRARNRRAITGSAATRERAAHDTAAPRQARSRHINRPARPGAEISSRDTTRPLQHDLPARRLGARGSSRALWPFLPREKVLIASRQSGADRHHPIRSPVTDAAAAASRRLQQQRGSPRLPVTRALSWPLQDVLARISRP